MGVSRINSYNSLYSNQMRENKAIEVVVGTLGFIIGGMLALWILIEIVSYGME